MGWLTILVEILGGLAVLLGALVPLASVPMAALLLGRVRPTWIDLRPCGPGKLDGSLGSTGKRSRGLTRACPPHPCEAMFSDSVRLCRLAARPPHPRKNPGAAAVFLPATSSAFSGKPNGGYSTSG
jgi:hypothetical protein